MKKQIIKKILASLLVVVILLSAAPISGITTLNLFNSTANAAWITQEAVCGENIKYTMYSDGHFVLSGTGEMYDYSESNPRPFPTLSIIQTITVEEGITGLSDGVFSKCSELKSIVLPKTLKAIPNEAFCDCSSLTEIIIPEGVTKIGDNAFTNCLKLEKIDLPDGIVSIGKFAFEGTKIYETDKNWKDGILFIGDYLIRASTEIEKYTIASDTPIIADYAFYNCTQLKELTIEYGIKNIPSHAFLNCKFKSISIPNSVESIGYGAFYGCSNLIDIDLPDTIRSISMYAFYNTELYTQNRSQGTPFYIDNYLLDIGSFSDEKFEIKDGTTIIADFAFGYHKNLKEVIIPDSVIVIGAYAFSSCENLRIVSMGNSVQTIKDGAFFNCKYFRDITLPRSITHIGNQAIGYRSGENDSIIKTEKLNLKVFKDSVGEIYAKQNELPYKILDSVFGDVNSDGSINSSDALVVLQAAVGSIELTKDEISSADVDKSGSVDSGDALMILQYSVGEITEF